MILKLVTLHHTRTVEVPDLLNVANQDFNNSRRSHLSTTAQLYGNCW